MMLIFLMLISTLLAQNNVSSDSEEIQFNENQFATTYKNHSHIAEEAYSRRLVNLQSLQQGALAAGSIDHIRGEDPKQVSPVLKRKMKEEILGSYSESIEMSAEGYRESRFGLKVFGSGGLLFSVVCVRKVRKCFRKKESDTLEEVLISSE